jgi:hypothetical protein
MCRNRLIVGLVLTLLTAACSASPVLTPDPDRVATEVSRQLTALPSETPILVQVPPTLEPASPTAEPATATAAPTATATATLTPTATVAAGDPRQTLGSPTWSDSLEDGRNWGQYEDEHTRVEARDGELALTALNPDGWSGWSLSWPQLKNSYLEAAILPGACSGLDRYGVVVRAEGSDQAYLYGFTCDGRFSLRKWDGEEFTAVQDWIPSNAINTSPGATNRVGIMMRGDRYGLYANGSLLAEVVDQAYSEGTIGLFVASANTPAFTVRVQEVAYWDLP